MQFLVQRFRAYMVDTRLHFSSLYLSFFLIAFFIYLYGNHYNSLNKSAKCRRLIIDLIISFKFQYHSSLYKSAAPLLSTDENKDLFCFLFFTLCVQLTLVNVAKVSPHTHTHWVRCHSEEKSVRTFLKFSHQSWRWPKKTVMSALIIRN